MKSTSPNVSNHWNRIAQLPQYKALLRSKKAFIVPASIFFIIYYFALPILVGWWPELMKTPILGPVNAAYLFALSEFFMAWAIAYIYVQKAAHWDEQARQILNDDAAKSVGK